MRYKNIIFDFGNVIGKFKGDYILGKFASTPEDYNILADAIFKNWVALDAGTIDYDQNAEDTIAELPDRLKDTARDFFENWFQYVDPLPETWEFIKELKARGVPIYLLSNASTSRTCTGRLSDPERIRWHRLLCTSKDGKAGTRYLLPSVQ